MHVERILSLNGGWSILSGQKQVELNEALAVLEALDDDYVRNWINEGNGGPMYVGYAYMGLCQMYNHLLKTEFEWSTQVPANDLDQNRHRTNCIKNGVLASIAGEDDLIGFSLPKLLHITVPYYHHEGLIDVAVIFVPVDTLVWHFVELGAKTDLNDHLPSEEFCRAEATRFIALTGRAPVVFAFFSSTPTSPDELAVEELAPPKIGAATVERTIEFAPEYYQAGVGLLTYFGEVLRQKEHATAKVRIEQEGRFVRLHVESPSGDVETIERELDQYALVISNQAPPESLFDSKAHIMQLETRLEIARLELKQAHDLKQLTDGVHAQQVRTLQQQVDSLVQQVAAQLRHQDKVVDLMQQQASSNERMQLALLTHGQMLFKDLLTEAAGNQRLVGAIESLRHNLMSGMALVDIEDKLEQAMSTIKKNNPGFLPRMLSELEGATYKATAGGAIGAAVTWLTQHAQ